MKEIELTPHASSLSQSMRDLGYSLEAAVADLIDNSISAGSTDVRIFLLDVKDPGLAHLAIVDDGTGMTKSQLLEAMRPGSQNPRDQRSPEDLGRFGLGLKTASFAQCKSLTVVSRQQGSLVAAQWDLDLIQERNRWVVRLLSKQEISSLPCIDELGKTGTLVLWQKLDRLLENISEDRLQSSIGEKLEVLERHLALVFHRYIAGEFRKRKLIIRVNGHQVAAFDPFCTTNRATQILPEETIRIVGHEVRIQSYILPHHSKLSKKENEFYRTRSDFVSNQGAYVYRNGRLMAWGDWFRIVPKSEATKLARVRIDFSNNMDDYWTIDIKKSRAHPPFEVKDRLRQIIPQITSRSTRVYRGRGEKLVDKRIAPFWERYIDRAGIRYAMNREHPFMVALRDRVDDETWAALESILTIAERSVPVEAIYADYAASPESFDDVPEITADNLRSTIVSLYSLSSRDKEALLRMIQGISPFSDNWESTQRIVEELT